VEIATGNAAMAAIDTGTTLIGGPSADVQNIWAQVPNSVSLEGSMAGFFGFRMQTPSIAIHAVH
jgi:cathepsin D